MKKWIQTFARLFLALDLSEKNAEKRGYMRHFFTRENAREMQQRSVAAQLAKKLLNADPQKKSQITDEFRAKRLTRVRKQIEMLDAIIDEELKKGDKCDPGKIDRLASAAARLNELERQHSNRSLPPVLKAEPLKKSRQRPELPEPED